MMAYTRIGAFAPGASGIRPTTHLFASILVGLSVFGTACADRRKAPDNAPPGAISRDEVTDTIPTPRPAPPPTACQMVSTEVMKETTGIENEGEPKRIDGADVCTWKGDAGKSVVVKLYPAASQYEQSRQTLEQVSGQKSQELSGVGDKAFFVEDSAFDAVTVAAQKGNAALTVQVMLPGGSAETLKAEATALAKKVADAIEQ